VIEENVLAGKGKRAQPAVWVWVEKFLIVEIHILGENHPAIPRFLKGR
jgi:hypothetical protein